MGNYLETHPETNQALTAIAAQRPGRSRWPRPRPTSTPIPPRPATSGLLRRRW
jgi:hypothetical protein